MTTPDSDSCSSGMFSRDVWMSFTQNLQMPSINSYQHLSTQYIDQLVDMEMERLKANCRREEDDYVEQKLLENPIIVERRCQQPSRVAQASTTQSSQQFPASKSNDNHQLQQQCHHHYHHHHRQHCQHHHDNGTGNGCKQMIQSMTKAKEFTNVVVATTPKERLLQQRADSCRRSRINNKIKKAKTIYRHKYMSTKLMQSVAMLECMHNLIDQTETQLMRQGFNGTQLQELRSMFSLDRN